MAHRSARPEEKKWPSLALSDAEIDEIMRLATPLDRRLPYRPRTTTPLPPPPPPPVEPAKWRDDD